MEQLNYNRTLKTTLEKDYELETANFETDANGELRYKFPSDEWDDFRKYGHLTAYELIEELFSLTDDLLADRTLNLSADMRRRLFQLKNEAYDWNEVGIELTD